MIVRRAVTVLAILLVASAVGAGGAYVALQRGQITVIAQFDSASGLYEAGVVAVLGMPVGEIEKITPKGKYVEVEFTVDKKVKVPADVQAVAISTSILTDRQIELSPPYRGGAVLRDHETIGLNRTKTPVEFDRVIGMLDKLSTSLKGDGTGRGPVGDIVNSAAGAVDGNGQKITHGLDELSRALRLSADGGAVTSRQIVAIISNLSALMTAVAENDNSLRDFASTIHQLSQVIDDESLGTGRSGRKLNDVVRQVGDVLEANRDHIKRSVLNGDTTLKTLATQQRELAEIIDVAPLAVENLYNIIDFDNGTLRARAVVEKILFESQMVKEICNLMGMRQLGCSTGTPHDYGPDFGLTYVLDGLAALGQK